MRSRSSRSNILFIVFVGVALGALLIVLGLLPFPSGMNSANQTLMRTTMASSKLIIDENAHPGTSSWRIPKGKEASIQIRAYASATSVLPGRTLTFYVSTLHEGTHYSIDIYRLGWYNGTGGRLMASLSDQIGHAQGYYDLDANRLVGCHSCLVDAHTGLVEADWHPSYTLIVPSDWITGIYLAKLSDADGYQVYVPFDVRGNFYSLYVAVTPDTTYAAYNKWGGYSLYGEYTGTETSTLGRGVKVSFDRPYLDARGSSQVLSIEADAVHWLEQQGYDLSYMSNVELHEDPAQLLHHRVYLSLGHDEYWTKEMRDGVENARDGGVGLAFLGANAAYWQMRFEPDSAGTPNRTIVCYKVQTHLNNLARDPLYGKDNTHVTALWRDPILARPENALIGIMYSGGIIYSKAQPIQGFPWQVSTRAKSALLDGTGLQSGQPYGCDLVGSEWDRIFENGSTPAGLQVLAESRTENDLNLPDSSNTTYYIASSGAMVFATGSIYWTTSLDSYRLYPDKLCASQNPVVPGMQKLMAHVMDALVVRHISGQFASATQSNSSNQQFSLEVMHLSPPAFISTLTVYLLQFIDRYSRHEIIFS